MPVYDLRNDVLADFHGAFFEHDELPDFHPSG
jgi:hypothetical protein